MLDYEIRCQRCERYKDNQSEENYDKLICDECFNEMGGSITAQEEILMLLFMSILGIIAVMIGSFYL